MMRSCSLFKAVAQQSFSTHLKDGTIPFLKYSNYLFETSIFLIETVIILQNQWELMVSRVKDDLAFFGFIGHIKDHDLALFRLRAWTFTSYFILQASSSFFEKKPFT